MRTCDNCFSGHYNLSDRGEEMFCDESEYMEEETNPNDICEYHRYYPGIEEEKNIVLYDEKYLGPGFLIIKLKGGKVNKFIKFYINNESGFPGFSIRAFSKDLNNSEIEFDFRDIEDFENDLFETITKLCYRLSNRRTVNIDINSHGNNYFELTTNGKVTKWIFKKDIYGDNTALVDPIDIFIGDDYTCLNYEVFYELYNALLKQDIKKTTNDDIKEMIIVK